MTEEPSTADIPASAPASSTIPPKSGLPGFWQELRRRHVIRVASVYAVVAWLIIQVAGTTFDSFGIPDWAFRFVVIMLVLGFPVSLIIAWALELTPEGIKLTKTAQVSSDASANSGAIDGRRRWLSFLFAAAVPTLIFAILVLVFNLRPSGDAPFANAPAQGGAEQSIAVLPLLNMSADPENVFFAGGVHEDILTNLSRINGLKVISRTSVMRYINPELSLRDIGAALGVRYIVEGSVRRINNHVRVTVQLIDAIDDTHLWANNYDRELVDVFATQSSVAREISNSLHLEIQPETVGTLQGMPTHSVKAYDLYIKARSIDRSEPQSEASLIRQQELLEAAVQEDPGFVEAWAFLNEVYDASLETLARLGWFVPEGEASLAIYDAIYEKSVRALKKAVALDPDNVETLIARASGIVGEEMILTGADSEADNSTLRKKIMDYTVEKHPESAMAWYALGWWHFINASDIEAAKLVFKKALELDPLHARIVEGSLAFYRLAADEEMVELLFERLAQISPEKGKDKSLARVNTAVILRNLTAAFVDTADESLIDIYVDELGKDTVFFDREIQAFNARAGLWRLQNNVQALLDMQGDPLLLTNTDEGELLTYLQLNGLALSAQQIAGKPGNVQAIARRIIQNKEGPARYIGIVAAQMTHHIARAYAVLGESHKAREWTDKLFDKQNPSYDPWGGLGLSALGVLDIDRAVKLLLAREASKPGLNIADWFAALHIDFRHMLVHPDMQAYYVKEGKWIEYLAARVPEYAQYGKEN